MSEQEEYIDYSCSTPIERLARDIETVLRSWHIVDGVDRHVSLRRNNRQETSRNQSSTRKKVQAIHTMIPRMENRATVHVDSTSQQNLIQSLSDDDIQLLRSATVTLLTTSPCESIKSTRINLDLDLCLWDGPLTMNRSDQELLMDRLRGSQLPFSLDSNRNNRFPTDILSSLSSLFGIGQHLTLTPTPSSMKDSNLFQLTIQALAVANHPAHRDYAPFSSDNRKAKRSSIALFFPTTSFFSWTGSDLVEDTVALHTAAVHSLSNSLQTALNMALSSCDCRIPAFGIWGIYRLNPEKNPKESPILLPTVDENYKSVVASQKTVVGKKKGTRFKSKVTSRKINSLLYSIMEVPPWIGGENLFDIAAESSPCSKFARFTELLALQQVGLVDEDSDDSSDAAQQTSIHDNIHPEDSGDSFRDIRSPRLFTPKNRHSSSSQRLGNLNSSAQRPEFHRTNQSLVVTSVSEKRLYLPPVFSGYCHSGPDITGVRSSFVVHVVPPGVSFPIHATTLNSLGKMLLQQCYPRVTKSQLSRYGKVIVACARHKFHWSKLFDSDTSFKISEFSKEAVSSDVVTYGIEWRKSLYFPTSKHGEFEREQQQLFCDILRILHHSYYMGRKSSILEPMWGPQDDPVQMIALSVTWDRPTTASSLVETADIDAPLLVLPLRIRSKRSLSPNDILDMENTILSTVFNPMSALPHSFSVSASFDKTCAHRTLSANVRCILASYIRACSLLPDTLLGHLTKAQVLKKLNIEGSLDHVSNQLMDQANVSDLTRSIVHALDWDVLAENAVTETGSRQWRNLAVDLIDRVGAQGNNLMSEDRSGRILSCHRLTKSCVPGSLLSSLFQCLGALRNPSDMSFLWLEVIDELRLRWARRETLNNMIPLGIQIKDSRPVASGNMKLNSVRTIGFKAKNSAFLYSSEVDPDLTDCLLAQKFQVFNIGVEIMIAKELEERRIQQLEAEKAAALQILTDTQCSDDQVADINNNWCNQSEAATEIAGNRTRRQLLSHEIGLTVNVDRQVRPSFLSDESKLCLSNLDSLPPSMDGILEEGDELWNDDHSDSSDPPEKRGSCGHFPPHFSRRNATQLSESNSSTDGNVMRATPSVQSFHTNGTKQDFYDAFTSIETATMDKLSDHSSDIGTVCSNSDRNYYDQNISYHEESTTTVVHRQNRRGARCPVHGVYLQASGDQLYAPYLLRPPPLTDDILFQRRHLLNIYTKEPIILSNGSDAKLKSLVETVHRLQKPKLLSDIRAFKAANPGAIFQDFVDWYGNPDNPFSELGEDESCGPFPGLRCDSASEASMAAFILTATRMFWSDTWDEAEPCPAVDQRPLFDPVESVETLLFTLESLHPGYLLNHVLAVNISSACFILEASCFACRIDLVRKMLNTLFHHAQQALLKLSEDMTRGTVPTLDNDFSESTTSAFTSIETLIACEKVCDLLGEFEVLISRATSLLNKFPGDFELVQQILSNKENKVHYVESISGRSGILKAIHSQQVRNSGGNDFGRQDVPFASVREYVLQNMDTSHSCQMSVRIGGTHGLEDGGENSTRGGLVLAISKCLL